MATATNCGVVLRLRICRICGMFFWICRHCDRGHCYCTPSCFIFSRLTAQADWQESRRLSAYEGALLSLRTWPCAIPRESPVRPAVSRLAKCVRKILRHTSTFCLIRIVARPQDRPSPHGVRESSKRLPPREKPPQSKPREWLNGLFQGRRRLR